MAYPLFSIDEQKEISRVIDEKLSTLDDIESDISMGLTKSETLRQSILKKTFSGQLVAQDPSDEPASVLLERIAAEKAQAVMASKKARPAKERATRRTN